MRAVVLLVVLLLAWSAQSMPMLLGELYLSGIAWLIFEIWRAPVVDAES
jgi:hypothetical protein